ncbi:MAG TPA: PDDEXK nuclease domain-containing protein, partial [Chitinispirillaceae bacterium]|nr:PDDEXK nuclease domain-containing protein [Chitinispirillaceae bacterium]
MQSKKNNSLPLKKTGIIQKPDTIEKHFAEVSAMILDARKVAYSKVDTILIELYWNIGKYISDKVSAAVWGDGTVGKLAEYLEQKIPDTRGFNRRGLYRMKQFYETYAGTKFVSPLVTQIQWANHLIILSRTKSIQEKIFYLQACIKGKYTKRELEHQISACLFERTVTEQPKLSKALQDIHPASATIFRDSYSLDFLGLPPVHFEADIRKGIVNALKNFLIEFGRDFAFIGEEYRVQAGMKDFAIDLLFYHRELQCLVAFELKLDEFKPEHLGKLSFY